MAALKALMEFNIENANVNLWAFKGPRGSSEEPPRYSGYWVQITPQVTILLKGIVNDRRRRITDVIEYGLLAQNNEESALLVSAEETYVDRIVARAAAQTNDSRVNTIAQLRNADFYGIKLTRENDVIYAFRKTDRSWQSRRALDLSTLLFTDATLSLEDRPKFDVDAGVDFILVGDEILILNKAHFESILRYKALFIENFSDLLAEDQFANSFADITPLAEFVGNNKLHLRRLAAIRQKGHYRNPDFMERLRRHHNNLDLHLEFDQAGKIIVTPASCREVITALLDHRLGSLLSNALYDVPSTTTVRPG